MSTSYTQLIWRVSDTPSGGYPGPTVPAGQLWVVRDVVFIAATEDLDFTIAGIAIYEQATGCIVAGVGDGDAFPGRVYHYELRQALNAGDQLNATSPDAGWNFSITGYKFTV